MCMQMYVCLSPDKYIFTPYCIFVTIKLKTTYVDINEKVVKLIIVSSLMGYCILLKGIR